MAATHHHTPDHRYYQSMYFLLGRSIYAISTLSSALSGRTVAFKRGSPPVAPVATRAEHLPCNNETVWSE
jgi:hypothetical protein